MKEEFHYTAYTTICYMGLGRKARLAKSGVLQLELPSLKPSKKTKGGAKQSSSSSSSSSFSSSSSSSKGVEKAQRFQDKKAQRFQDEKAQRFHSSTDPVATKLPSMLLDKQGSTESLVDNEPVTENKLDTTTHQPDSSSTGRDDDNKIVVGKKKGSCSGNRRSLKGKKRKSVEEIEEVLPLKSKRRLSLSRICDDVIEIDDDVIQIDDDDDD